MISPTFSTGNLKALQSLFDEASNIFIKNIEKLADAGKPVDIFPYAQAMVFDTVARACFAAKIDSMNDPHNPLLANARLLFGTNISISQLLAFLSPTLQRIFGFEAFHPVATSFLAKLSMKNIQDRLNNNDKNHHDKIQYLLDAKSDKEDGTSTKQSIYV